MNATHTPGPWDAIVPSEEREPACCWHVISEAHGRIVTVHEDRSLAQSLGLFEEIEANARLIAAAPELLAALEELAWRCERFNCDQNITTCVRDQVADAIAKAKGESS